MSNSKLNEKFYKAVSSLSGDNIIKMIKNDLSKPKLTELDKVILNYIKKRYIDCHYSLSPKKKYFIDVNFDNIRVDMTEDELEQNIIIFRDTIFKYRDMEINNHCLLNDLSAYIIKQLKFKGIEDNVSFTIFDVENGGRFIYIYYTNTELPVLEINTYNLFRFYGTFPIKVLSDMQSYNIISSITQSVTYKEGKSIDKDIYISFKAGAKIQDIATKYNLPIRLIHEAIARYRYKCKDREEFMDKLYIFLRENYNSDCIRIINCLNRYLYSRDIFDMKPVIDMIKNDDIYINMYIRGIGIKSNNILREFLKEYESTN